jgi:hypothetical protein
LLSAQYCSVKFVSEYKGNTFSTIVSFIVWVFNWILISKLPWRTMSGKGQISPYTTPWRCIG